MRLNLRRGERWQASRLENAGFAFCGDPCSEPEAPDYSGIASANEKSAQLAKEAADNQLAFSREQYDFLKPYIQKQLETGHDVATQQQADSAKASDRADQQWSQYQTTFQPIEEKMALEAMDYGSAADQERDEKRDRDETTHRSLPQSEGASSSARAIRSPSPSPSRQVPVTTRRGRSRPALRSSRSASRPTSPVCTVS